MIQTTGLSCFLIFWFKYNVNSFKLNEGVYLCSFSGEANPVYDFKASLSPAGSARPKHVCGLPEICCCVSVIWMLCRYI